MSDKKFNNITLSFGFVVSALLFLNLGIYAAMKNNARKNKESFSAGFKAGENYGLSKGGSSEKEKFIPVEMPEGMQIHGDTLVSADSPEVKGMCPGPKFQLYKRLESQISDTEGMWIDAVVPKPVIRHKELVPPFTGPPRIHYTIIEVPYKVYVPKK